MSLQGVYLPIITPFINGEIDFSSYEKLLKFYIPKGISGLFPNGTTGESPTLSDYEFESLLQMTIEITDNQVPVYFGAGGNYTKKLINQIKIINKYPVDGILSVSPYYNRPDQRGIYEHFKALSETTEKSIVIYNIPYRTGRNVENETIFRLSELPNIVGIKDSCGDFRQSMDLLLNKPVGFSVLTGEDILYYPLLTLGGDGGILASAHLCTSQFVDIFNHVKINDCQSALKIWSEVSRFIPYLFAEPNPAPIKHILARDGMIRSDEVRLPLVNVSEEMKNILDLRFKNSDFIGQNELQ